MVYLSTTLAQEDPFEAAFFYKLQLSDGVVLFNDAPMQLKKHFAEVDAQIDKIPAEEFVALLHNKAVNMQSTTGFGSEFIALTAKINTDKPQQHAVKSNDEFFALIHRTSNSTEY